MEYNKKSQNQVEYYSIPLTANASYGDEYGSTFTFTTTPNKWKFVPACWYSEKPVSNTLTIQIKGKAPLNKIRYRLEGQKWTSINIKDKNWVYNKTTGFNTLNLSIKEMKGFFDVEVYDTNPSGRKIKITFKGKINKIPIVNSINRISDTSVKINWKKINHTLDVDIMRSTSLNGSYKRIARVYISEGSYTDKNIVPGKKYYYKLRYSQGAWNNSKAAEKYQCQISKNVNFSDNTFQKNIFF